jgi:hypothetical protein
MVYFHPGEGLRNMELLGTPGAYYAIKIFFKTWCFCNKYFQLGQALIPFSQKG